MLVPVMLLKTGCESAPGELQGRVGHCSKITLSTQPLFRTCVRFDKAAEQAHSVLYALGDCDRRQVARFFDRHLRFCGASLSGVADRLVALEEFWAGEAGQLNPSRRSRINAA